MIFVDGGFDVVVYPFPIDMGVCIYYVRDK